MLRRNETTKGGDDELLEPFSTRRLSLDGNLLRKIVTKVKNVRPQPSRSPSFPRGKVFPRLSSSNWTEATEDLESDCESTVELEECTVTPVLVTANLEDHKVNPIAVANVAGDNEEFRRFKEDLRKSKMLTGVGTQQIIKEYIESRSKQVEAKRKQDQELSRIKNLASPPMGTEKSDGPQVPLRTLRGKLSQGLSLSKKALDFRGSA
mmetsp:Transcript_15151/g.34953  ORF Transcript_15151/g.34953 Transcript_15151/m.34953 type:complete len:207 (-) Transcript_15151:75-695(-)|eukprot:CAMPEP_0116830800 /NCGR_PEP_ID=MMETSP0418-20121206/4968_1 /TAXON_ID=1158023 /ORGANISM="Astrosyne radiata, Strain 13vi08-1A" /LENGTH=206 /DNA_ID=CAMNT_0004459951 /DNA_START=91 /DNA_END=711 /DNA_ORIENTATION=+